MQNEPITHEKYLALPEEERELYGPEPTYQIRFRHRYNYGQYKPWMEINKEQYDLRQNIGADWYETRSVHYLKPVEAQHSEAEGVQQAMKVGYKERQLNAPSSIANYCNGFRDASQWQAQKDAAQITALQTALAEKDNEIERLKDLLVESAKYGYEYHATSKFGGMSFESNCKNNYLQWLTGNPSPNPHNETSTID